ncbi:phenylalanine--tRNA ligase subunit beta [Candidatus Kaiserbacteria bacterium]|nr:phenylalanine--tRNA ligase subunit beta [Candidatus Kaiserbacteria bacterium]
MKVSRQWLQTYFEKPLPDTAALADALTFHAFEIDEIKGDVMDVKVLPNRAADCLSHRGIAKELSAILNIPLKSDPLREPIKIMDIVSPYLKVEIEDPKKCSRYMGALVRGVKVRPSPDWLKEALESVEQRPINNIVDATNYVMLNIGQPLHAFNAKSIAGIIVRGAKEAENITVLSGETYKLSPGTLLITDASTGAAIGIAGVKGGKQAEITDATTDIIVESANFDSTSIRRAVQALRFSTDASQRFQNRPSPELCAYGMRDVLALIQEIAGGEVVGVVDEYPARPEQSRGVSISLEKINSVLGSDISKEEVESVFARLGLEMKVKGNEFTITPPFERTDITIPEDLAEEVGRIQGYDRIPTAELPPISETPDQARYRGIERMKDQLVEQGFIEVSTQSFVKKGDVVLANPLDTAKPALRPSLEETLQEALTKAIYYAPLVLAPNEKPKLFEVGTVFSKKGEHLELRTVPSVALAKEGDLTKIKLEDYGKDYKPKQYKLGTYKPFSAYPFIVRDIAFWVYSAEGETPPGPDVGEIKMKELIREHAGPLLVQIYLLDRFPKEGRISYAFRLVFQSTDRTLTDAEVNAVMADISGALSQIGHEVR